MIDYSSIWASLPAVATPTILYRAHARHARAREGSRTRLSREPL